MGDREGGHRFRHIFVRFLHLKPIFPELTPSFDLTGCVGKLTLILKSEPKLNGGRFVKDRIPKFDGVSQVRG